MPLEEDSSGYLAEMLSALSYAKATGEGLGSRSSGEDEGG